MVKVRDPITARIVMNRNPAYWVGDINGKHVFFVLPMTPNAPIRRRRPMQPIVRSWSSLLTKILPKKLECLANGVDC